MSSYKTQAVIVGRLNLGESDRILTLFSPEMGKIRAVCKGSRKTKSKFGGHVELFTLGDFVITSGKNLDIVNDVTLNKNFFATNPEMEKIKTAYYFAEVINKLLPDESPNPELYELFLYCLEHLDKVDIRLLQLVFIARLLKNLGIYPELSDCVKCETKPDKKEIYFSKSGGGIMDQSCSMHFEDAIKTDEDTIKLWRYVTSTHLLNATRIAVKPETIISANLLAIEYIHSTTMIDYKSLRVLS